MLRRFCGLHCVDWLFPNQSPWINDRSVLVGRNGSANHNIAETICNNCQFWKFSSTTNHRKFVTTGKDFGWMVGEVWIPWLPSSNDIFGGHGGPAKVTTVWRFINFTLNDYFLLMHRNNFKIHKTAGNVGISENKFINNLIILQRWTTKSSWVIAIKVRH